MDDDNIRIKKLEDGAESQSGVLKELLKENKHLFDEVNKLNNDKTENERLQGRMIINLTESIGNISTRFVAMEDGLLKDMRYDIGELKKGTADLLKENKRKVEKIQEDILSQKRMLRNLTTEVDVINKTLKMVGIVH